MRDRKAFSIIELCVVMVIIILIVNYFVPHMNKSDIGTYVPKILKNFQNEMSEKVRNISITDKPVYKWEWNLDAYNSSYVILYKYLTDSDRYNCNNILECVGGYKTLNSEDYTSYFNDYSYARFLINNKKMFITLIPYGDCKNSANSLCGIVVLDINNKEEPNTLGYDVFMFGIYGNGMFMPYKYNVSKDEIEEQCANDSTGETCTAKIMIDDWKMLKMGSNPYPFYTKEWQN